MISIIIFAFLCMFEFILWIAMMGLSVPDGLRENHRIVLLLLWCLAIAIHVIGIIYGIKGSKQKGAGFASSLLGIVLNSAAIVVAVYVVQWYLETRDLLFSLIGLAP